MSVTRRPKATAKNQAGGVGKLFRETAVLARNWARAPLRSRDIFRDIVSLPTRITQLRPAPEPGIPRGHDYHRWLRETAPSLEERLTTARELAALVYRPRISIVTPIYNVERRWLELAVSSVVAQTYDRWELCLVDDGSTLPYVRPLLERLPQLDGRIKTRVRSRNGGIVTASNDALSMVTGEFVALLDHDDEIEPDALAHVVQALNRHSDIDYLYTDEDKLQPDGHPAQPFFKPGWSPELLEATNYACHLSVIRTSLMRAVGGFRRGFDGAQDYDLILRVTEQARRIHHIPKILYHWRMIATSTAASADAKPQAHMAGRRAVEEALSRRGEKGDVLLTDVPGCFQVRRTLKSRPAVTIIIPTRDRADLLSRCVESLRRTSYRNFEIVIVDNGSREAATHRLFREWSRWSRLRVLRDPRKFNYSALNNRAVNQTNTPMILFLNNDTEVIDPDWLDVMVEYGQKDQIGAVGARLLYPDGALQHAGVALGIGGPDGASGVAGHIWGGLPRGVKAPLNMAGVTRNFSAVTAACLLMRRQVFEEVGGFDERIAVAYNDVDLCLKIRARNYRIVCSPGATLVHHESATRGRTLDPSEVAFMLDHWGAALLTDPYYSPSWSLKDPTTLRYPDEQALIDAATKARRTRTAGAAPQRTPRAAKRGAV